MGYQAAGICGEGQHQKQQPDRKIDRKMQLVGQHSDHPEMVIRKDRKQKGRQPDHGRDLQRQRIGRTEPQKERQAHK